MKQYYIKVNKDVVYEISKSTVYTTNDADNAIKLNSLDEAKLLKKMVQARTSSDKEIHIMSIESVIKIEDEDEINEK